MHMYSVGCLSMSSKLTRPLPGIAMYRKHAELRLSYDSWQIDNFSLEG